MLFRQHRGSLEESMKTVVEVETLEDIVRISQLIEFGYDLNLRVNHYCMDERIGWDTYIVTDINYGVIGFTNGDIK